MNKKNLILIVLLIGFLLRLPNLTGSFWMDEAAQALESERPLGEQHKIADDFQPPLLHYLVHFLLLFSRNEAVLRSVSLFCGICSIGILYLIMKKLAGEKPALLGAVLLAINPFHIFFSQELRQYSLACFFACLSWLATLEIGDKKLEISRQKKKKFQVLFVAATIGGMYSMYLYPLITFSQLMFVLAEHRKHLRSFLFLSLISYFCFIPWLPFFIEQLRVGTNLTVGLPGWASAVATPQLKALPLTLAKFVVGQVELKDSFIYVLASLGVILLFFLSVLEVWRVKKLRFLIYWFFVPLITAWLISFIVPVIQPKRVMAVLPAFVGILGMLATKRKAAFAFLVVIFLAATYLQITTPKYQRENWRDLILAIERDAYGSKSTALFAFPQSFAPWRWYAKGKVDEVATGVLHLVDSKQADVTIGKALSYDRVYLFDYLADLSDPKRLLDVGLKQSGFGEIGLIDGGNVGFVRVFSSL